MAKSLYFIILLFSFIILHSTPLAPWRGVGSEAFRPVLLRHLSQQREAWVLNTVSVNTLYIYHKQFYLLPSLNREGTGVGLYFSTLFLC